jgi:succinoglycan biosynthesis transport protein ExoP
MLHRPIPSDRTSLSATEVPAPAELLDSFVHFLRQQRRVILTVSLLSIALGVAYLIAARPTYTATAAMLIDTRKTQFLQQQPLTSEQLIDPAAVESQVIVLKSDNIALSVIKKLRLNEDREFIGSDPKSGATFLYNTGISAIKTLQRTLREKLQLNEDPELSESPLSSEYLLMRRALDSFKAQLDVKRDPLSYIIEVSFKSYDAEKAARVANAIVDAYIEDQLDAKYQSTLRASNWLQDRIRDLREQASAGEQAVVDYRREHNILILEAAIGGSPTGKSTSGQRVSELNSQLIIARTQTAEARARLDRIQAVLSSDSSGAVDSTVTDTLKNDVVTKLRSQYLDLQRRAMEWSARYGSSHLAVVNLRDQMRVTRAAILDELRRVAETYKSDFEIAKQRNDAMQKEYDQAVAQAERNNQAQVVLSDLESKSKTYRALYENFLQRYMDSVQQQSFPITEARMISPAARPSRKSAPQTFLTLAIAACAGMLFGFAIGVLRDMWDKVFRTAEQVQRTLHTTCLALVPNAKAARAPWLPLMPSPLVGYKGKGDPATLPAAALLSANGKESDPRIFKHDNNVFWRSVDSPFSRFAETIRGIKLAVDLNKGDRPSEIVGFTSSLPNEGKSTLAASMALLIAQAGARVILIDCDLRNPSLTRTLTPSAKVGLIEAISDEQTKLEDVLWWSDPKVNLAFLPAVMKSRLAHTNEILASAAIKKFFDDLRQRYEYIIVDFSPIAPVVDVRTTAHLVNSYVYVIQWGSTKIDVVKKALGEAPSVYEKLLGTVLNRADIGKLSRYEAHRGAYYDNKHYSRYGLS